MTRDEIFSKVQEVLEDALGVDQDEVKETSRLTKDLEAESIDFLDITFQLDKAFGFKIQNGELFPDGANQDPYMVENGKVTPKGIQSIKARLPYLDLTEFEKDPQVTKLADQFTAGTLVDFVQAKLEKEQTATA